MRLNEIQIAHILDEARKFSEEEKYLHAAQMYQRLMHLEPTLLLPYMELSSLYASIGNMRDAISLLHRARINFPDNSEVLYKTGDYYLQNHEYDQALSYFSMIPDARIAPVHYKMGVTYFFKDNLEAAEKEFRLTLKIDPSFPRVNESIGELLLKRGLFEDAVKYLRKGIIREPYNGISHFLLGIAYGRLDQWKKAYDEFVLSIDMDPQEAVHWQLCSEALVHLARYDEAEQYIRKSLELDKESVDGYLLLAQIYVLKKEYDKSRDAIANVLALDPKNRKAKKMLANLSGIRKKASKI